MKSDLQPDEEIVHNSESKKSRWTSKDPAALLTNNSSVVCMF